MKETLTLTGTVELGKTEVIEAIDLWLSTKKQYNVKKTVFLTKGNSLDSVVVDVARHVEDKTIPQFSPIRRREVHKKMPTGWKRQNVGVFKEIEGIIEDERKKGNKELSFDAMYELVHFLYPKMTRSKLAIYIRDRRQLKNVEYDSKRKMITF